MNHETARLRSGSRIESLPFSKLPHQTKLFLDYTNDPVSLKEYYPNAVASVGAVRAFSSQVLAEYTTDRAALCDALAEINGNLGAGENTLTNIARLRTAKTVAVVTGQQAGLFTGPLYTIYKALSAIKMAERLNAAGTPAVPVFWVASEDHDLDEVAKTFFIGNDGGVTAAAYKPASFIESAPIGNVILDESIVKQLDDVFAAVDGPNASSVRDDLAKAWSPGASYATAFARSITWLLGNYGLVIIDPQHEGMKLLSSRIYCAAIEKSSEINAAIRDRTADLVASGYHGQVLVEQDHFPLFWHTDKGRRVALRKTGDGVYRSKDEGREFTVGELVGLAAKEPQRFSPGVVLRPVVQDFLLPTICYFGGAAEIAYFAQNSEVYRVLGRPVTPILHRQSFTVIEPKQQRILDKLEVLFDEIFAGSEAARTKAVERAVAPETAELFVDAEKSIGTILDGLDKALSGLDPTLSANLSTRRKKIVYHIDALKKKAFAARLRKEETVERQIQALFNALLPNGELQERSINIYSYIIRYGPNFVDTLYDAVDLDDRGHRIIQI